MTQQPGRPQAKPAPTIPESGRLAVQLWWAMVVLEIIHQIFNVVISLIDPSAVKANANFGDTRGVPVDDVITVAIIMAGVLGIGIMVLLAFAVYGYARNSGWKWLRTLLVFFSVYFAVRAVVVFTTSPTGTAAPTALYLIDGSLQILTAVAGVLGLIFSRRADAVDWQEGDGGDGGSPVAPGR
ncbi:hypothetical protein JIM95_005650 [Corynebacterium sp. CCM 8835]|uniref:Uncharacterized protein n=1 Tax=Corynebacterium antarcticum TaxID=2800405 RepID=A0A9Q4CC19_9CORY|nr:hypothetical protein [Corynebacterium antarcticum]MCK7642437.1 hypothetical protein [Corynebacterium antarcticum]MCK7660878.1 hypothetical protein [Corynebacterium antarcticum]MCL0245625.1 hypothetical protein [Corynebacterium antarcticum]MCX7491918.1 hypothetical protein [Corynebacterium antarcticum]MCX7538034.1 hypothetical protein [Corynebacterium antarcticum]